MSGHIATTEDYDLRDGGILGLGMLFMVVSPLLASQLKRR